MTLDEIQKEFEKLHPPRNDLSEKEVLQHGALVVTAVNFAEHILRVAESKRSQPIATAPRDGSEFIGIDYLKDGTQNSALATFFIGHGDDAIEVMRIAKDGFYWKGEKVEDVHNVYERFNKWLTSAEFLKDQK